MLVQGEYDSYKVTGRAVQSEGYADYVALHSMLCTIVATVCTCSVCVCVLVTICLCAYVPMCLCVYRYVCIVY